MAINPLQTQALTASPRDVRVQKKNDSATTDFQSLLNSMSTPEEAKPVSPQTAAELLRIQMMQSTLALSGDRQDAATRSERAIAALLQGLDRTPGRQMRSTAALETAEAQEWEASMPSSSTTRDAEADGISRTASEFLGTPYLFGGEGPSGIDCSSFVQQVFQAHHISLPRTAREQIAVGSDVAPGDLQKGDLVFFQTYASYPSHVGIYLGDGKMIHASSGRGEVTVSDMNSDYYNSRYLGAKRVI
ncbi:C40 family peptidase [Geomonas oryzae]|uniref:C40 family peptidase n=1 Tax=Geomonas oryzae TaxID=2364273 RepID=UPI00100A3671|nr:C40 family peptidase [Geomonas oryzae]